MGYKAIYTYAWDLAETGVADALGRFGALGLDTVTFAGSYHAGKFLRPHGKGKVYFPEDGTVYFKADPERYGAIKPVAHSTLAERDVLRELTNQRRLETNVWLVLMHNTRLGMKHPESAVANAFGDRYVYNLCPSAPDARAYAIGLARDVTDVLSGQRRLVGDAGLPALCARISSRVRAEPSEPLVGQPARPLLLRALPGRSETSRHPHRSAAPAGRWRHRSLSFQRRRFSGRHGRSLLARGYT